MLEDQKSASYLFDLPQELIAQRSTEKRSDSRLLVYHAKTDTVDHSHFSSIADYLPESAPLVRNTTQVIPARLFAQSENGGKVEILFLSFLPHEKNLYPCLLKSTRKKRIGETFLAFDQSFKLGARLGERAFLLESKLSPSALVDWLKERGNIALPPYIRKGVADARDQADYQTVYQQTSDLQGLSVAAPTAGLHFSEELFASLKQKGHPVLDVCLGVSAGTFAPVQSENLSDHDMHTEFFQIPSHSYANIVSYMGSHIAIGTTSLRTLESLARDPSVKENEWSQTDLFLYPPAKIHSIQGLITNFHLPASTLIMLVSTLVGREKTLELYRLAVAKKYRFYSYGDAMLCLL